MIQTRNYETVSEMRANYARIASFTRPQSAPKPKPRLRLIKPSIASESQPDPIAARLSPQGYLRKWCREIALTYDVMMNSKTRVITAVRQQLMLDLYEEFPGISMQRVAMIFNLDNATFHHARKLALEPQPFGTAVQRLRTIRVMFEGGAFYREIAAATGFGEYGIGAFIREQRMIRP